MCLHRCYSTQVMSQSGASDAALAAQMARLNEAALRLEGLNKNIMDEVRLFDALKVKAFIM